MKPRSCGELYHGLNLIAEQPKQTSEGETHWLMLTGSYGCMCAVCLTGSQKGPCSQPGADK